jgi:hypothetical protein
MLAREWRKRAWISGIMIGLTIILLFVSRLSGCSVERKGGDEPAPVPPATADDGDQDDDGGDDDQDDDGGDDQVGGDDGAAGCSVPVYADVQPIFEKNCANCHTLEKDPELAAEWGEESVRRINLGAGNRDRMPPSPKPLLDVADKQAIAAWVRAGKLEKCPDDGGDGGGGLGFIDFDATERAMLDSLENVEEDDAARVRFLSTADLVNQGATTEELETAVRAAAKALNGLNVEDDDILMPTKVGPGLWQIDLEDFGLDGAKWQAIIQANSFTVVSNTDRGKIIRDLTATDEPMLFVDDFIDTTHRNSAVYYTITETPLTLAALEQRLGIDLNADIADFEVSMMTSTRSPISLSKPRMLVRGEVERGDFKGAYWQTFDPLQVAAGEEDRNPFEFPFLAASGFAKNFDFAASEVIYTLPNGLHGYALFAADGTRQDAAPLNVVADNKPGPRGPEIRNAISCLKCHAGGFIRMEDQMRAKFQDGDGFVAQEIQAGLELYKPQGAINAAFTKDNGDYARALEALGISPAKDDPINVVNDSMLADWDAAKLAARLFLRRDDLVRRLRQSAVGSARVGQLATGGTATFDQVVDVFDDIVADLRLFEEPL